MRSAGIIFAIVLQMAGERAFQSRNVIALDDSRLVIRKDTAVNHCTQTCGCNRQTIPVGSLRERLVPGCLCARGRVRSTSNRKNQPESVPLRAVCRVGRDAAYVVLLTNTRRLFPPLPVFLVLQTSCCSFRHYLDQEHVSNAGFGGGVVRTTVTLGEESRLDGYVLASTTGTPDGEEIMEMVEARQLIERGAAHTQVRKWWVFRFQCKQ